MPIGTNFYYRSFVVLQEEREGYGNIQGKGPTGYCKLESRGTRGKISLTVQNLKYMENEEYGCFLISSGDKGTKAYEFGKITINPRGRGDLGWEFDTENIGEISIREYQAICIAYIPKKAKKYSDVVFPLVGYFERGKNFSWNAEPAQVIYAARFGKTAYAKEAAADDSKMQDAAVQAYSQAEEETPDETPEEIFVQQNAADEGDVEAEKVEPETVEEEAAEEAVVQQETKSDTIDEEASEGGDEYPEEEARLMEDQPSDDDRQEALNRRNEEGNNEPPMEKPEPNREKAPEEYPACPPMTPAYWESVKGYFDGLFAQNTPIQPFVEEIPDSQWIQIQYGNPYTSPYTQPSYVAGYYPAYEGYGYYIVGLIRKDKKVHYICYGVPGRYSILPPAGLKGFCRWIPARGYYGMGYWMMYLDAETGETVYPL